MCLPVTDLESQVWGNQHKTFNLVTGNELFKKKTNRLSHIVSQAFCLLRHPQLFTPSRVGLLVLPWTCSEAICIAGCTLCLEWSSILSGVNYITSFKPNFFFKWQPLRDTPAVHSTSDCLAANLFIPPDFCHSFPLLPILFLNILCNLTVLWIYHHISS